MNHQDTTCQFNVNRKRSLSSEYLDCKRLRLDNAHSLNCSNHFGNCSAGCGGQNSSHCSSAYWHPAGCGSQNSNHCSCGYWHPASFGSQNSPHCSSAFWHPAGCGGQNSNHCSCGYWHPASFGSQNSSHSSCRYWHPINNYGDGDSSFASSGSTDKNDNSDFDEDTLAWLRIFFPELYEKAQMKRMLIRDIIIEKPNVQWTDIANQVKAKKLLQEAIILPLEKPSFFRNIRKPWKGVLMVGPPGTGKTMLAKAVATERNITFFNVSVSTLTSKFFGESEKLIKMLFEEARVRAPSVIFIDEIDSLCSYRGEQSEHEVTRRMKSELLCHMDGVVSAGNSDPTKSIVILGASNFPWNIDDAFLRRMEKRIYVPLPDTKGREELLTLVLREVEVKADVDLELIADQLGGFSASDIVVVCRDAAFMAMRKAIQGKSVQEIKAIPMSVLKKPISMQDFQEAISKCQKTVTTADIQKFEDWNAVFGSSV